MTWIACKDRMPEEEEGMSFGWSPCVLCCQGEEFVVAAYSHHMRRWQVSVALMDTLSDIHVSPSHWQPLPPPPKATP